MSGETGNTKAGPPVVGAMLAVLASLAIAFSLLCEIVIKMPLPLAFYLIVGGAYSGVVLLGSFFKRRLQERHWVGVFVVSAVLACLYVIPWSPRKPFLRAFTAIETGMEAAEVRQIMDGYLVSGSDSDHWRFQHSVSDPRYASDWGEVYFESGRVARKEFLPD